MYNLLIISCLFSFLSYSQDFELLSANYQKWSAGVPDGGKGSVYFISVKVNKTSDKLKIEQLWVKDKYYDVKIFKGIDKNLQSEFNKGDTINIIAAESDYPPEINGPKKEVKKQNPPYEYKGEALIGYKVKNKNKYFIVDKFNALKSPMFE